MKVTLKTIKTLPINDRDKDLLEGLLIDLKEINQVSNKPKIYIEFQDWHNEYSPERTDPCPDYYGYYTIRSETCEDLLGVEMDLDTLDTALCLLNNYLVYL